VHKQNGATINHTTAICQPLIGVMTSSKNVYEVRPRKDHRGDALPFGRLWYGEPDAISNAIDYVKFYSRSHDATICVYDDAGNVIETHEQAGDFREYPGMSPAGKAAGVASSRRSLIQGTNQQAPWLY